jgi:hypothetical protein
MCHVFLHLPIYGKLVKHQVQMSKENGGALLNELFGVEIEVAYDKCEKLKDTHIS